MIDINLKDYIESMENNLKRLKECFAKEAYENDEVIITKIERSVCVGVENGKIKKKIAIIVYYKHSDDEEIGITEDRYLVI